MYVIKPSNLYFPSRGYLSNFEIPLQTNISFIRYHLYPMAYTLPSKQPVTPPKNSQKLPSAPSKASRPAFPDFDLDEDEEEDLGINPLLDVDFTDLELDSQEEFSYQEEEEAYFDEDEEEDLEEDDE
jgi:hypothetical protein